MNNFFKTAFILISLFLFKTGYSQGPNSNTAMRQCNANWIAAQNDDGTSYGVFYFRKSVDLKVKPNSFIIHVSADNRYKLFVNGTLVSLGPARGDIYYWNYETVDLAPYLKAGENSIAAQVWNEAQYRPEAQVSIRTAFILQGNTAKEEILNTDESWKCIRDEGYSPIWGFFAASMGEMVDMNQSVLAWNAPDFDDTTWPFAAKLFGGLIKGNWDGGNWMLVPSSLPQMEMTYQRIPVLRKAEGMTIPTTFPGTKAAVTIPAHTSVTMLLDQTYLTNAYLTLNFSGGKDANIVLKYAETLMDEFTMYGPKKSNRNEVEGKIFYGRKDSLISSGRNGQSFTTLNYRTYRYIQLKIQTQDEALSIDDIYGTFTGYPFEQEAVFNTDNTEIKEILEIGWRTARLNAMETYMDCPYYEQLQYIGDTRIQALITYYNSSDDRLARNALNLMDHSRLAEGVTLSRYPTKGTQIISTFSLWYIGMLHDYWMYRPDAEFIKEKLTGQRAILDFFSKYQQADGSLKDTPYWNFVDWANGKDWFIGAPPKGSDGSSAIIDMQLLWAYQWASEMESQMGMKAYATLYKNKAELLKETILRKYWDADKKLFADTDSKTLFSQHANSLAVLTGLVKDVDMKAVCESLLNDKSLTECTLYFRYYMHQALAKGGLGNDYMKWLDVWRNNIKMGLTTWAEISNLEFTRSECHAWGSSPNIEFYRIVLGIDSDAPGFSSVKIEPHLGTLTKVGGEMPHANGKIAVEYVLVNSKWKIEISLPENTSGTLVWKGKKYKLKAGGNSFSI